MLLRVNVPGGGVAAGWGSETAEDFGDFIEKAETKALGRPMAALGFGTQFHEDFDFLACLDAISTLTVIGRLLLSTS